MIYYLQIGEVEGADAKDAKAALLRWCQLKTEGYKGVNVTNFSTSWTSGLAFNAIIHRHRPDLLNYDALNPADKIGNLQKAFDVAESLGIDSLLDPQDIVDCPDDKAIMTYLMAYYNYFTKMASEDILGQRMRNFLDFEMGIRRDCAQYEQMASDLLEWVLMKIKALNKRDFPNSLVGVQQTWNDFKDYSTTEKPPKSKEKSELQLFLYQIQMKLSSSGRKEYAPPERLELRLINREWDTLEKSEKNRAAALRKELMRMQILKQLAEKFTRKADLREEWLRQHAAMLGKTDGFGEDLTSVVASQKREDAIKVEIQAYDARLQQVDQLVQELRTQRYWELEQVDAKNAAIKQSWEKLSDLLDVRKGVLADLLAMYTIISDIDDVHDWISDKKIKLEKENSRANGRNVDEVNGLIEKHSQELDAIALYRKTDLDQARSQVDGFARSSHPKAASLGPKFVALEQSFAELDEVAKSRSSLLRDSLEYRTFEEHVDRVELWIYDRLGQAASSDMGTSIPAVEKLINKQKVLQENVSNFKSTDVDIVAATGTGLLGRSHEKGDRIKKKMARLGSLWSTVTTAVADRKTALDNALVFQEYAAGANDIESWMNEKEPLASSSDYGKDTPSAAALLRRHQTLFSDIESHQSTISELRDNCGNIADFLVPNAPSTAASNAAGSSKLATEPLLQDVPELKQVKASYPYTARNAKELSVAKGEVLTVKSEKDAKWWKLVRTEGDTSESGYVPASYVKVLKQSLPRRNSLIATETAAASPVAQAGPDLVRASYDYTARNAKEMSVKKGDVLSIKSKKDDNWWKLRRTTGDTTESGYVPAKYVKAMSQASTPKAGLARRRSSLDVQEFVSPISQKTDSAPRENAVARQQAIEERFEKIYNFAKDRKHRLELMADFYEFQREVDELNMWMAEKLPIIASKEECRDVDQWEKFNKQFNAVREGMDASTTRKARIDELAESLCAADHPEGDSIRASQQDLDVRWLELQHKAGERAEFLQTSEDIVQFQQRSKELCTWINGKLELITSAMDDVGNDLNQVRRLKRVHDAFVSDLAALENKVKAVEEKGAELAAVHTGKAPELEQASEDVRDSWNALQSQTAARGDQLTEAYDLQNFFTNADTLISWMDRLRGDINDVVLAGDVPNAEAQLDHHQQLESEIQVRQDTGKDATAKGHEMIERNHFASADIQDRIDALGVARSSLDDTWAARNAEFEQCFVLQKLKADAQQLKRSLDMREIYLGKDNLGDSVDQVQSLLKEHADFDKLMAAHAERVAVLAGAVDTAVAAGHYDQETLNGLSEELQARVADMQDRAEARHKNLNASALLQHFLASIEEVDAWTAQRILKADDKSYEEPSNLRGKLQDHQDMQLRVNDYQSEVDRVLQTGADLVAENHYAGDTIVARVDATEGEWARLRALSDDKAKKLGDAMQEQSFNRFAADLESFCDDVQRALASETAQEDFSQTTELGVLNDAVLAAEQQKKKYAKLSADVAARKIIVPGGLDDLCRMADEIADSGNFRAPEILARKASIVQTYEELMPRVAARELLCSELAELQTFWREIRKDLLWIEDKTPEACSEVLGDGVAASKQMHLDHTFFDDELREHSVRLEPHVANEQALLQMNLGAAATAAVSSRLQELQSSFTELQAQSTARLTRLANHLCSQKFYVSVQEAEDWIKEKKTAAEDDAYGDEETTLLLITKHDHLLTLMKGQEENLTVLVNECGKMVQADFADKDEILKRSVQVQDHWEGLEAAAGLRKKMLAQTERWHTFNAEVDESQEWIQEMAALATSTDYGSDLEGCENLANAMQKFRQKVTGSQAERVTKWLESGAELIEAGNFEAERVEQHVAALNAGWSGLVEAIGARDTLLKQWLEIHGFVSHSDMNLQRIAEVSELAADGRYGTKLSEVLAFMRNFRAIELDVKALGQEVTTLTTASAPDLLSRFDDAIAQEQIAGKKSALEETWAQLGELMAARKGKLLEYQDLHLFYTACTDQRAWLLEMAQVCSNEREYLTKQEILVAEAEELLDAHSKRKGELDTYRGRSVEQADPNKLDTIQAVYTFGTHLIGLEQEYAGEVKEKYDDLQSKEDGLVRLVQELAIELEHTFATATFNKMAGEAEAWVEKKTNLLVEAESNGLRGDMKMLLVELADIENSIAAYEQHVTALRTLTKTEQAKLSPEELEAYGNELHVELQDQKAKAEGELEAVRAKEDERRRRAQGREVELRGKEAEKRQLRVTMIAVESKQRRTLIVSNDEAFLLQAQERSQERSAEFQEAQKSAETEAQKLQARETLLQERTSGAESLRQEAAQMATSLFSADQERKATRRLRRSTAAVDLA